MAISLSGAAKQIVEHLAPKEKILLLWSPLHMVHLILFRAAMTEV